MYKSASRYLQHVIELRNRPTKSRRGKDKKSSKPEVPSVLYSAYNTQKPVKGRVENYNYAGFLVRIEGFLGFCPYSLMYPPTGSHFEKKALLGQKLLFVVKDVTDTSVVLSRRAALLRELIPRMEIARDNRSVISGIVKHVEKYGAFVDLGGIDGLVHISEVSDQWIGDLAKTLSVGTRVQVLVLAVDREKERLALSIRRVPK